jgi:hypothetical protein
MHGSEPDPLPSPAVPFDRLRALEPAGAHRIEGPAD